RCRWKRCSLRYPGRAEISPHSLHDALPICDGRGVPVQDGPLDAAVAAVVGDPGQFGEEGLAVPVAAEPRLDVQVLQIDAGRAVPDRKSTRLNSSHVKISYAVFCLKKHTDRP